MSQLLHSRPLRRMVTDVISVVTPRTEAGACIPEHGEHCWCQEYFIGCDPYYCYYSYYWFNLDCYGTCKRTSTRC